MTCSRRMRAIAGVAGTVFLLSACGIGNVLGDRVSVIYVKNDTSAPMYAGATEQDEGPGFGSEIAPGRSREVIWTTCKTAWLVLSESDDPSAVELARHEITLCPGDDVMVNPEYELTIECGERSLSTREAEC